MALLLTLSACTGALLTKIREIVHPPTYGIVLAEALITNYSNITDAVADSLIDRYAPDELAVLEYHIDESPLAFPNARRRAYYYQGSFGPGIFIDGQPVSYRGFYTQAARNEAVFRQEVNRTTGLYQNTIDRELRLIPPVTIDLTVEQSGPMLDIKVEVVPVTELSGEPLRLRIALVEKQVVITYASGDIQEHRMVVRDMVGGMDGFEVVFTPDRFSVSIKIDIRQIESRIYNYLSRLVDIDPQFAYNETYRETWRRAVQAEQRRNSRIDIDRIRLVAFVQRETDRAVLQAAIFDLKP